MLRSIRFSGVSFLFSDNRGAAAEQEQQSFPQRCVESMPRRRIGNAAARGCGGYSEASEQDSNIVYGFHLIPIYNRA